MLSVIIPAYNEEQMIDKTAKVISGILQENGTEYELLFIDDGSKDKTWDRILANAKNDSRVRGISFSRNFGKESALFAGLSESKGDCVVAIDCDLQHPPIKIVEMYKLWLEGYEVIEGVKADRGRESFMHRFAANSFYSLISTATGIDMSRASDFKLLDRKAVNVLLNMPEKNAFFRALSSWVGFKTIQVEYVVQERTAGVSKWSTKSLIKYAITNITSFTSFPLQLVTIMGAVMFVGGILLSVHALYQKFTGVALGGFTTVIILQCFTGSITMISLGIIGYYIAKIYDEVKGRPRFIIGRKTEDNHENPSK